MCSVPKHVSIQLQAVERTYMLSAVGKGEHGYVTGALVFPLVIVRRAARYAAVDMRHRVLGTNTVLCGSGVMVS